MSQAKQITNPYAEKQRLVFRRTAAETEGELLEMEAHYAPEGAYPPEHYHPYQDEHFEVLKGRLQVRINGREYSFQASQTIDIPRGTVHTMRNGGNTEASVIWQVRPALKTQPFFETLYGLAAEGQTDRQGRPNLLQLAVLLWVYRDEFVLARPALPVQKLLFGALASVGKLLGYRGRYEKYSGPEAKPQDWQEAQVSIWINRPPEDVFRFVANYNNDTRWRQGVARMTQSPLDKTEVGTVTHEEKDLLGQRFVVIAKITAFEPDRRLDWASVESAIPVKGYRLVEPEGSGARFTLVIKGKLQGIYRWLAPLMMYTLRKEIAQDVAKLKAILE
jgi:quercetin dioxygenase-like cupin family protein